MLSSAKLSAVKTLPLRSFQTTKRVKRRRSSPHLQVCIFLLSQWPSYMNSIPALLLKFRTVSVCSSLISNWSVPLLHSWIRLPSGSSDSTVYQQLHGWRGGSKAPHPGLDSSRPDERHTSWIEVRLFVEWMEVISVASSHVTFFLLGAALTSKTLSLMEVTPAFPGRTWCPTPPISLAWTPRICKLAWAPTNPTKTLSVTCGKVGEPKVDVEHIRMPPSMLILFLFLLRLSSVGEQFLPANQGPNSVVGDQHQQPPQQQPPFNRGPPGNMGSMPMGPRQQYPYGPGYDRRWELFPLLLIKPVSHVHLIFTAFYSVRHN